MGGKHKDVISTMGIIIYKMVMRKRLKRGRNFNYQGEGEKRMKIYKTPRAPVPNTLKTNLRYFSDVALNATGTIPAVHIYSANGLYDPNITGTGHQPRGFDQLMLLYDHAVVIYSKCTTFFSTSEAAGSDATAMVALRSDNLPGILRRDYIEMSEVKWDKVSSQQGFRTKIIYEANPNVFLNRSKPMSDPDLKNSNSSNPAEQAFWHIAVAGDSSGDPTDVSCETLIEYTVIFMEPRDPGNS